jgi:hypothetical protein
MNTEAMNALSKDVDGYALVQKSLTMRAGDPSIEFASALIASSVPGGGRERYTQHAEKAKAGAKQDALLAKNLGHISS